MAHFPKIKCVAVAVAACFLFAGSAWAGSIDLCRKKIEAYKYDDTMMWEAGPSKGIAGPVAMAPEVKEKLKRMTLSQCMLSLKELNENYNGKSPEELAEFFDNYKIITEAVPKEKFEEIFPRRLPQYTYEVFLKSAMAFPMLCMEQGEENKDSQLDNCRREFATMFAHWHLETAGLSVDVEGRDQGGGFKPTTDLYFSNSSLFNEHLGYDAWQDGKQSQYDHDWKYCGRGPKQLSWNSNYLHFGWGLLGDVGQPVRLVQNPTQLVDEEFDDVSFMSGFWFYMTPMSQKPSMHEVVTGVWTPNEADKEQNITPGYGATIDIINGAIECGKGTMSESHKNRELFYKGGHADLPEGTLKMLGLSVGQGEVTNCMNMKEFTNYGSAAAPLYYHMNEWQKACYLSVNENPFNIYDQTPLVINGDTICENGYDCCLKVVQKLKGEPRLRLDDFAKFMKGEQADPPKQQ